MTDEKFKLPFYRVSKKGIVTAYISINGKRRNMKFNSMKEFKDFVKKAHEVRYRINANQYGREIPFGKVFDEFEKHMSYSNQKQGSFSHWHRAVNTMPWIRQRPFHSIDYDYLVDCHELAMRKSVRGAGYRKLMTHFSRLVIHLNKFVAKRGGVLGPCIEPMELELFRERCREKKEELPVSPDDCLTIEEVSTLYQFLQKPIYTEFICPNRQPNAIVADYTYKRIRFENWQALSHMFMVAVSCGLRIGAICSLKKKNWKRDKRKLLANSSIRFPYDKKLLRHTSVDLPGLKNAPWREIDITSELVANSLDWLCAFGDSEYLFPQLNPKYNKDPGKPWQCPRAYSRTMKELASKAGVKPLSSHKLNRKTYVTLLVYEELFINNGDLRSAVAKITKDMKWKSESVAMRYIVPLYDEFKKSRKTLFERIERTIEGRERNEDFENILKFKRRYPGDKN